MVLLSLPLFCLSQNTRDYEQMVYHDRLEEIVRFLADDDMKGRASGTLENTCAERYIISEFRRLGLAPYNWNYTQSVRCDTIAVRNVVGVLRSARPSDKYIVVSAHYDHLGEIAGKIYNGADDNASGVAALLSIAEMFSKMREEGKGPARNIIFVAFDGKECDMAGSRHFVSHLSVPKSSIICDVNIDMLGTDLVPPGRNGEYMIFLGEETLPECYQSYVSYLCRRFQYRMDLDQTFYGSRDFAKFFYGMSDQKSFRDAGIPAVVFSSAFHKHTYKPTDDPEIINYPLLRKRILVIFNFINHLCS